MDSKWRDQAKRIGDSVSDASKKAKQHVEESPHAKRIGDSVSDASKKAKQRIEESAPEVSRKVRQQIREKAPVVSHRVREVGKALTSSVPEPTPPAPLMLPEDPSPSTHSGDGFQIPAHPVAQSAAPMWASQPALPPPVVVAPPVEQRRIPTSVWTAVVALLVAAVASGILAAMGVYGLAGLRESADKVLHLDTTGTASFYANDYLSDAQTYLTSITIALGFIFALTYLLFAYVVRRGHRWPRPIGAVLAVLSLPAIFLGPAAVVAVMAGIVAALALWMPSARQYAADRTAKGKSAK